VVYEVTGACGKAVSRSTVPMVPDTGSVVARVPAKTSLTPVRIVVYEVTGSGIAVSTNTVPSVPTTGRVEI